MTVFVSFVARLLKVTFAPGMTAPVASVTLPIIEPVACAITAVLAVIPLTAVYSPLVDLVVSGIEAVLAVLPVTAVSTRLRGSISGNPHHARVVLNKTTWRHETPQGAYRAQWNGICNEIGLPQAKL